jgi:hypothetical protein
MSLGTQLFGLGKLGLSAAGSAAQAVGSASRGLAHWSAGSFSGKLAEGSFLKNTREYLGIGAWKDAGFVKRGLLGAGIGGAYQAAFGPGTTSENRFSDITQGMLGGATAGLGLTMAGKLGSSFLRRGADSLASGAKNLVGRASNANLPLGAYNRAKGLGRWAKNNPNAILGATAAVSGAALLGGPALSAVGAIPETTSSMSQASLVRTYDERALMESELQSNGELPSSGSSGSSSVAGFSQLANSTNGLVNGLHQRRHG